MTLTATAPPRLVNSPCRAVLPLALCFPHGWGDVLQALPSFRRLADTEGRKVSVGVLSRLPACAELLRGQPWCASTFGLPDPWNDFAPANTWEGYRRGMRTIYDAHPYAKPVLTRPPSDDTMPTMSKAARIAAELGVAYVPENPIPDPSVLPGHDTRGFQYVRRLRLDKPGCSVAVIHGTSGNRFKDVDEARLTEIAHRHLDALGKPHPWVIVRFPVSDRDTCSFPRPAAFHRSVVDHADLYVGVDSGPAHLASTSRTPVVWVFTSTPIAQAVPLWDRGAVTNVCAIGPGRVNLLERWEAWRSANADLVRGEIVAYDGGRL